MTSGVTSAKVVGDLATLVGDWERSLRAANKSERTVVIYGMAARRLEAFLVARGIPTAVEQINREHLEAFTADQLARHKPATASQRYRALAQLWKWLLEEGEVRDNPFTHMKPPRVPDEAVPILGTDDLRALLATCGGNDFEDRRDTAMIRLLIATGMRAGEIVGMRLTDLDRESQVVVVVGNAKQPRSCPYGMKAAAAIDRYLRVRARHPQASSEWLWIGRRGRITDSGLRQVLNRRTDQAGLPHLYPHQFRHTFAHDFLSQGGNEGDLMTLAGWQSRQMLQRYGASAAADRARESYERMGIGDRV